MGQTFYLNTEKLFTETAFEHKAAIRSLEIKLARQERLIKMLLSTLGHGRPGADTDDGNNDGTEDDDSNADGNEDTPAANLPQGTNGIKLFSFGVLYGHSASIVLHCIFICCRLLHKCVFTRLYI